MINSLLALDTELLIQARNLIWPEYTIIIQFLWESIVVYAAIILLWLWFTGLYKKDNAWKVWSLQIFFTIILTFSVYTALNFGIDKWRPSPQDVVWTIAPLIPHPLDNSFPSGHSLFTAALLIGVIKFSPKKILIFGVIFFWFLTAASRVIGWVHYPGDIIGGWILGGIGAYIMSFFIDNSLFRKYIFAPIIALAGFFRL